MKNHLNFSFDVGMTSLGIAVNENGEIIHGDVLLMHEEAGSVKAQAERRRMLRTRDAHKKREETLESLWRDIGKKPLQRKSFRKTKSEKGRKIFIKTKADERLEREFPAKGDPTVYASGLLRIMLIEGQQLEDWQIYKALHAGIQRRGYDAYVPWKTRDETREEKQKPGKDENPEAQVGEFNQRLQEMTPNKRYHLPCYYDAWKMRMWDNKTTTITSICQPSMPKESGHGPRGYNPSRELVTREIEQLLAQAAKQIPALAEHLTDDKRDQLLYGEQQNAMDKRYPSATEISGLLGQKYPRVKNRIVSKCAAIPRPRLNKEDGKPRNPRLNVCKAGKPLAIEVGFLMRLVNWRYEKVDEQGVKQEAALTSKEIVAQFQACENAWNKKNKKYAAEEYAKCFKLTSTKVIKLAEKLGGTVKVGHEEIPASKHAGRSRYSQPALYLLKQLILSDKTPRGFYNELVQIANTKEAENPNAKFGHQLFDDVPYKYFADDLWFLHKMGDTRGGIHTPDVSLADRYLDETGDVDSAIRRVISTCNWPQLRHRLNVFRIELENLVEKFGEPDAVHLEFIREDFLNQEDRNKYIQRSDEGREKNRNAIAALKKNNIPVSDKTILHYRLYDEQNHQCVYTAAPLNIKALESYEVDHIFPKEGGGPDAYYNKVLTTRHINKDLKYKRLPCECDDFINWVAFQNRVNSMKLLGRNKKKLLLASSREEAEGLIEKYTGLAGTAHIARLARDIVCLRFGWQPGEADEQQRIFVCSGGLTSKVAKKYKLYRALGDGSKHFQKDRSDHRHHALDAMIISYLRQWARDKNKTDFFKFPNGINAEYFAEKLADVYPRYVTKRRPALAEQPKPNRRSGKNTMNTREYKNISKDPDERGQWYTNKTETGKGTSQHGYIFYLDGEDKLCSMTVHSFRSPYAAKKEVEKKSSKILGLFYEKQCIYLPNQDKVKATRFGRKTWLPYGDYRVVRVNRKEGTVIDLIPEGDANPSSRYRINLAMLEKIVLANKLLGGQGFELSGFRIKKDELLTGHYKVDQKLSSAQEFTLVNTQNGENNSVKINRLLSHLTKHEIMDTVAENITVKIDANHRNYIRGVTTDSAKKQQLLGGHYQIKGFGGGGNRIDLIAQDGTVYQVRASILTYAKVTG